jgi:aconitase B
MEYRDLKKGDKILTKQLGTPISGELLESPKQGKGLKKSILIYSNGEEIGMFSEAGSVYASDILKVNRDGTWHNVTGQPDTEDQEKMLEALEARNGF